MAENPADAHTEIYAPVVEKLDVAPKKSKDRTIMVIIVLLIISVIGNVGGSVYSANSVSHLSKTVSSLSGQLDDQTKTQELTKLSSQRRDCVTNLQDSFFTAIGNAIGVSKDDPNAVNLAKDIQTAAYNMTPAQVDIICGKNPYG